MNRHFLILAASLGGAFLAAAPAKAGAFVWEQDREFYAVGDFDGDGHQDVVIVDKPTGKYRLGYQLTNGIPTWVNHRLSTVKDITGVAIGSILTPKVDSIVFTSADGNLVTYVDASKPGLQVKPVPLTITALGPVGVAATDIGGKENNPLADIYLSSIYNDPTPNKITLLRNKAGALDVLSEADAKSQMNRANRVVLKAGGPELVAALWMDDGGDTLKVEDLSSGTPKTVLEATGFKKNSDLSVASFRGGPLADFLVYKRGESTLQFKPVEETGGKLQLGEGKSFDLGKPIRLALPVSKGDSQQLLVLFGKGETAELFKFNGASAPESIQTLVPREGNVFFGAAPQETAFLVFSGPDYSKFATHYQFYKFTGSTNEAGTYGKLASMADSDDATVPEIHKRLVETLASEKVGSAADMKAYTNIIPGTKVSYAMLAIPGGEFTIGSPETEKGRAADEGPQKKVKISPFWMGKFEITWNEYELFMYPDDEKKLREQNPSDGYVNKVSDAVTRPSKPYVEMSFGMGRDGYPAICMTQHAANKYCHWLSAKTGHFYRLPTEAEWEYACRAGTTTAYSFGDDAAKLSEYGWFEQNGDFKYQKVGKKKPNPWGLYDMHGNVWEWCIDQYQPNYEKLGASDPWTKATLPYPHSVKGGSYDDEGSKLRSATRRGSDRSWKMRDPQLPKSIWWHSDAPWVGFRLVRPLTVPAPEDLQKYWTSGVEKD